MPVKQQQKQQQYQQRQHKQQRQQLIKILTVMVLFNRIKSVCKLVQTIITHNSKIEFSQLAIFLLQQLLLGCN